MKLFRILAAQLVWFVALLFRLAEAHLKWFAALLLLAGGYAFAQAAVPLPGFDFTAWGASVSVYAGIVAATVALLKARIPTLTGPLVLAVSFVLSEVGAFLLYSAHLLTDRNYVAFPPPYVWIAFGAVAFVIASGGYNLLAQLLSKAAPAPDPLSALPIVGNHVIFPTGTPGTEPLIHNGQVIGAVRPLTGGLK